MPPKHSVLRFENLFISRKAFRDVVAMHTCSEGGSDSFSVTLVYDYAEKKEIQLRSSSKQGDSRNLLFTGDDVNKLVEFWVRKLRIYSTYCNSMVSKSILGAIHGRTGRRDTSVGEYKREGEPSLVLSRNARSPRGPAVLQRSSSTTTIELSTQRCPSFLCERS